MKLFHLYNNADVLTSLFQVIGVIGLIMMANICSQVSCSFVVVLLFRSGVARYVVTSLLFFCNEVFGILVGSLELFLKLVVSGRPGSLLLSSSLRPLLFNHGGSLCVSLFFCLCSELCCFCG